jgi:hypothetical protein
MSRLRRILRASGPWLALLGALIAHQMYARPGYISFDSLWQFRDAQNVQYNDWHPPIMALIWHFVDKAIKGSAGMLLLQELLFLLGCYGLFRRFSGPAYAALAACLTFLFVPIGATLAVIWKDSLMVGCAISGVALLLSPSRPARLASLVLFTLVAGLRYNGFTVSMALIVVLFEWRSGVPPIRRFALATMMWAATVLCGQLINGAITVNKTYPWHGSVALYDIQGVVRYAPPLSDDVLIDYLQGTQLGFKDNIQVRAKRAYNNVDAMFGAITSGFLAQPTTEAERAAIKRAWGRLVADYPWAYLKHRWRAFRQLLGMEKGVQRGLFVGRDEYGWDINDYDPGPVQKWLQQGAEMLGTTWLFRPYLYFGIVLGLTALAVAWRHRTGLALGLSAMLSELALFFASPTADFRYSLWLVVCAFAMFWILLIERSRQGPGRQPRAPRPSVPAL